MVACTFHGLMKGHVRVVPSVSGKLDFEIAIECGRRKGCLREMEADRDDGKLCTARGLDHVQIAVTISGVKGFDRHSDEEIALSGVAGSLTASGAADTVDLMNGVRHVIGEGGLVEDPGLIGRRCLCDSGECEQKKR